MTAKLIQFELPESVYARLNALAHLRGTTTTALLSESAYEAAKAVTDPVVVLWAQGLPDAEVAARLGWTNTRVKRRRARLNLPANRRTWTTERKAS